MSMFVLRRSVSYSSSDHPLVWRTTEPLTFPLVFRPFRIGRSRTFSQVSIGISKIERRVINAPRYAFE